MVGVDVETQLFGFEVGCFRFSSPWGTLSFKGIFGGFTLRKPFQCELPLSLSDTEVDNLKHIVRCERHFSLNT